VWEGIVEVFGSGFKMAEPLLDVLRSPNVIYVNLKPSCMKAKGYHGPLSTRMRGLLLHSFKTSSMKSRASRLLCCQEAEIPGTIAP